MFSKQSNRAGGVFFLYVRIGLLLCIFGILPVRALRAATYNFIQSDWSGGVTSSTAVHPTNITGWNKYSATSSNITAGTTVQLTPATTSVTQTDDGTTNTGFNLSGAAFSSTTVSGTGSAASVTLSQVAWAWSTLTNGSTTNSGGALAYTGGDYIYALAGNNTNIFTRYSISGNTWTTLATTSVTVTGGGALVYPGSGDFIYASVGGGRTNFYKYSISANTWTSLANYPIAFGSGTALAHPGVVDFIYAIDGGNDNHFYKYSISGNSWTALQNVPTTVQSGGSLAFAAGDLYAFTGTVTNFYKYSTSTNTWTAKANALAAPTDGGWLVYPGYGSYIYASRGSNNSSIYQYDYTADSWSLGTITLAGLAGGSSATFVSSTTSLYTMRGGGTNTFYKGVVSRYLSPGTFTSGVIDMGGPMTWGTFSYTVSGQTVTLKARTSSTTSFTGATAFASCSTISSGAAISTGGCATNGDRYIQYQASLSTSDTNVTPSLSDVTITGTLQTQTLTSSAYDTGSTGNILNQLAWTEDTSLPSGTSVTLSLRAASSQSGLSSASWSDFTNASPNCSKSGGTVTCSSSGFPAGFRTGSGAEWFQYKISLTTTSQSTPTVSNVTVQYVVNAPPDFDTSFGTNGISVSQISDSTSPNWGKVVIQYRVRDTDTSSGSATPGFITPSFKYNIGGGWVTIPSTYLKSGDVSNKAVDGTNYTTYTATWNAAGQIPSSFTAGAQVQVIANDNELANNTGTASSATFTLDTTVPAVGGIPIVVDASQSPAAITLSANDDSTLYMRIGKTSDLSSVSYVAYNANATLSIQSGDTVYVQFRDAYGNTTSTYSATPPTTPTGIYYQDISNITTSDWRIFFAWGVAAVPNAGFKRYDVYRATNGGSYSLYTTNTNRMTNYIVDSGLSSGTSYSYKVAVEDLNNDISGFSSSITKTPNGVGGTDLAAPTITNVTVATTSTTGATITWTTNKLSNSTVYYAATTTYPGSVSANYGNSTGVSSMVTNNAVTLSGLTPNTQFYFMVQSTDISNNVGSAANIGYTFTTLPGPVISNTTVSDVHDNGATVVWNTNIPANSVVEYSVNADLSQPTIITGSATLVKNHSVTISGLTTGTKYYYYVTSTDGSGNVAQDVNVVNGVMQYYTFSTTNDTSAPVISNIQTALTGETGATITWTTDKLASSQVTWDTHSDLSTATSTTETTSYTLDHAVVLNNLATSTQYYYTVLSTDRDGNRATSPDPGNAYTFTTRSPSNSTSTIYVTTTVYVGGGGGGYVYNSDQLKNGSLADALQALSSLSENQSLKDNADLEDMVSNFAKEVVSSPVISGTDVSVESGANSATIKWKTNKPSNSLVAYGKSTKSRATAYDITAGYPDDHTLVHEVTLNNLDPNTKYHFQVRSQGEIGPAASSTDRVFETGSTHPQVLGAHFDDIGEDAATLSWKTVLPTNTQITLKNMQTGKVTDEKEVGYDTDHTFSFKKLDLSTDYTVTLVSTDNSKNVSKPIVLPFTTVKSGKPPVISDLKITTSLIPERVETAQTIVSWTTDKPATSEILFGTGDPSDLKSSTPLDTSFVRDHVVITTLLHPGIVYKIRAKSADAEGHDVVSDPYTVKTPAPKGSAVDAIFNNLQKTFGAFSR